MGTERAECAQTHSARQRRKEMTPVHVVMSMQYRGLEGQTKAKLASNGGNLKPVLKDISGQSKGELLGAS